MTGPAGDNQAMDVLTKAVLMGQRTNYPPSYDELCEGNAEYERRKADKNSAFYKAPSKKTITPQGGRGCE